MRPTLIIVTALIMIASGITGVVLLRGDSSTLPPSDPALGPPAAVDSGRGELTPLTAPAGHSADTARTSALQTDTSTHRHSTGALPGNPSGMTAPVPGTEDPLQTPGGATVEERVAELFASASPEELEAYFSGEGPLYEELFALFEQEVGADEAGFMMELTLLGNDWPAVRDLLTARSEATGNDYRDLMLARGLPSGQMTAAEIMALLESGLSLPPMSIHLLAMHGQAGDIAALATQSQFQDINERFVATGHTAIGTLIEHVALTPSPDPSEALAQLTTLLALGIETSQAGGQLDLLSHILLEINPTNSDALLTMAAHVVQAGVISAPDEMSLWQAVPAAEQERLQRMFAALQSRPLQP
ncbi:MAG: hypothetical protein JJT93_11900 [Gammaproteobacteria bacterium]|nr:hypothetical protein [Gammaproteobacteria bacterium]